MKKIILLIYILSLPFVVDAQKQNNFWAFGHNAAINFNTSPPTPDSSSVVSRGSCASICDTNGTLQFYVAYDTIAFLAGSDPVKIYNRNDQVMVNGDSLKGGGWYHEIVIVPKPGSNNQYFVFYIGVTLDFGLYYSIVDMNSNNGLGAVIQKNIQLQNFEMVDCLTAIKHGNGRDWWIVFRKFDPFGSNSKYYSYLISPVGISIVNIQNIGSQNSTNSGRISFNSAGNKMVFLNYKGLLELFDFDRCTGILSNPLTVHNENTQPPWPGFWSSEFSPSGERLYVTRIPELASDSSRLYQYDLLSTNIAASKDTLWSTSFMITIDQLKRAPDNKMYLATNYYQIYPYADSVYNYINMNLSVINNPDSLGLSCNLQPFSFFLGGKRAYAGLPNNPDYDLGPLVGSACDSLTAVQENGLNNTNAALNLYYHPGWETLFVNAQNLKGTKGTIKIYDTQGNIIYTSPCSIQPPYFTKDIALPGLAQGVYVVQLQTEKEILNGKFVK